MDYLGWPWGPQIAGAFVAAVLVLLNVEVKCRVRDMGALDSVWLRLGDGAAWPARGMGGQSEI